MFCQIKPDVILALCKALATLGLECLLDLQVVWTCSAFPLPWNGGLTLARIEMEQVEGPGFAPLIFCPQRMQTNPSIQINVNIWQYQISQTENVTLGSAILKLCQTLTTITCKGICSVSKNYAADGLPQRRDRPSVQHKCKTWGLVWPLPVVLQRCDATSSNPFSVFVSSNTDPVCLWEGCYKKIVQTFLSNNYFIFFRCTSSKIMIQKCPGKKTCSSSSTP